MTKESIRKEKIIQLIKNLILRLNSKEYKVPRAVSDFILQGYELCPRSNAHVSDHEMNELVNKLEDLIRVKHGECRRKCNESERTDTKSQYNFIKACETFVKAKNKYFQISRQLISLLNEINGFREKYCDYLKEKAALKQDELKVLKKKVQILKGKSILQLYKEKNAFDAHLRLMEILATKLKNLELAYDDLVELDAKFSELKNNKMFCDLLVTYKHLLMREKKLDYMIEK